MGETVGLVGVGLLGSAIAERLKLAGFAVLGWDLDPAKRTAGARFEAAVECERIILSLPHSGVVERVLEEMRLRPGQVVIDTTTGDPKQMAEFGARLKSLGVAYLDATVGGSSRQVAEGAALAMVGGEAAAFEANAGLLRAWAGRVFYMGPVGSGSRMKLVFNLVLGLHRAVLAEGLTFADKLGVDAAAALEVLQAGGAYSRVMDTKGRKMLSRDFEPEARLSQHLKDVRLILDCGARTPLSSLHCELLEEAERLGCGALDNSSIIRVFDALW